MSEVLYHKLRTDISCFCIKTSQLFQVTFTEKIEERRKTKIPWFLLGGYKLFP